MMSPRDLQSMALRIERLQHTDTHGWHPGDDLDFKNLLPSGRDERRRLPNPETLRNREDVSEEDYRNWISTLLRLETLIHRNDPRNPQRMMRDMMHGKMPRYR